jgi:hypothetical protein
LDWILINVEKDRKMETQFKWKAKFFNNKYEIFQYDNIAGTLSGSGWKRTSSGDMRGKKVQFENKGFFKQEFLITDPISSSVLGNIVFNTWRTKATITLQNKVYNFQFENFFHSKWSITNENGNLIRYHAQLKQGDIISYTDNETLILTGLYIRDYLLQRAASASAAT